MNARGGYFVNQAMGQGAKLLAAAVGCAMLAGCVGNPFEDAKVDPRSPIAKEVAGAVRSDAPYPRFAEIPAKPTDLRPRKQYGQAAAQAETAGRELAEATAADRWTLEDTPGFASQAQQAAGPDAAPPTATAAQTEAYAATLRKRATPPPPAKH
jgi:hypothetical protein